MGSTEVVLLFACVCLAVLTVAPCRAAPSSPNKVTASETESDQLVARKKRELDGFYPGDVQKRFRELVGKRDNDRYWNLDDAYTMGKRLRELLGKRRAYSESMVEPFSKRLRELIGK